MRRERGELVHGGRSRRAERFPPRRRGLVEPSEPLGEQLLFLRERRAVRGQPVHTLGRRRDPGVGPIERLTDVPGLRGERVELRVLRLERGVCANEIGVQLADLRAELLLAGVREGVGTDEGGANQDAVSRHERRIGMLAVLRRRGLRVLHDVDLRQQPCQQSANPCVGLDGGEEQRFHQRGTALLGVAGHREHGALRVPHVGHRACGVLVDDGVGERPE